MAYVPKEKKEEGEIVFFGEVDRNPRTGAISSEYPSWFWPRQLESLKDELRRTDQALDAGVGSKMELRAKQRELKAKVESIEAANKGLTDTQKDKVRLHLQDLEPEIARLMPNASKMKLGTADPHKEVEYDEVPCIKVDAGLARDLGVRVEKGKVTRAGAQKMWKIMRRRLGEESNIEALRKE
jgi:chromosome segregation ATPase